MPRVYPKETTKICPSCNRELLRTAFPRAYNRPLGIASHCKECRKARYPYDATKHKHVHLRNRYGLEWDEYIELFLSQNKKCRICDTPLELTNRKAQLDHCHVTGKVRGFLCSSCNRGLGCFKDDTKLLEKAMLYIKEFDGHKI